MQAFDHGPWPRMSGRQRGSIMHKLAALMEVGNAVQWQYNSHAIVTERPINRTTPCLCIPALQIYIIDLPHPKVILCLRVHRLPHFRWIFLTDLQMDLCEDPHQQGPMSPIFLRSKWSRRFDCVYRNTQRSWQHWSLWTMARHTQPQCPWTFLW
jgi:hypothetical protein